MTQYLEYLTEAYRLNAGWEAQHREWVRRFGIKGTVLDAGAGLGHLATACASVGCNAIALERDLAMLNAGETALQPTRRIQGDVAALPFRNESFDWVLSNQVIEHVQEADVLLGEARRVLRPNGRLLLTTPNRRSHFATRKPRHFWDALRGKARSDPTHVIEYVPREVRRLLRDAEFAVEVEEAIGRLSHLRWLRAWAGGVLMVARRR